LLISRFEFFHFGLFGDPTLLLDLDENPRDFEGDGLFPLRGFASTPD